MSSSSYICTIDNSNIERTKEIRKSLSKIYGPLRLRGRHSNRKKVLGDNWRKWNQNDVPWVLGEQVSFYIHDGNPNFHQKTPYQIYREYYEKKTGSKMVVRSKHVPQF